MDEAITPDSLAQQIASLRFDDADAALEFLDLPDLAEVGADGPVGVCSPKHWVDIYRPKLNNAANTGTNVYGGTAALQALEKLPADEAITLVAFESESGFGLFWLRGDKQLVGFAIMIPG